MKTLSRHCNHARGNGKRPIAYVHMRFRASVNKAPAAALAGRNSPCRLVRCAYKSTSLSGGVIERGAVSGPKSLRAKSRGGYVIFLIALALFISYVDRGHLATAAPMI